MAFGLFLKKVKLEGLSKVILGIALIIAMLALGIMFPVYATKTTWIYVVFVYIFFASVTPMWLLKTPRDYLTTFLFIGMISGLNVISDIISNSHNGESKTSFLNADFKRGCRYIWNKQILYSCPTSPLNNENAVAGWYRI